jgi:puromycin-sensitive aminopeptidase
MVSCLVKPISYHISYDCVDLDACLFSGTVKITLEVKQRTAKITLNCADLWVQAASVTPCAATSSSSMAASCLSFDIQEELVTVQFPEELPAGEHTLLCIKFSGELNDKLVGLYRSLYDTPEGKKRVLACTQFEPCDARRAFPCFDVPALKARFTLEVMTPLDRVAISNTPVQLCTEVEVDLPNGTKVRRKLWKFEETPLMSTYLVALVIGEFDSISMRNKLGVTTTVYLPRGKAPLGQFALKTASAALEFYATHVFKVPYPLPKSDLLAIPNFSAGAMENWGCVTYRETKLLADEATSSIATLKSIARTICHELAHQWFGNLVTMESWTYLWLNEGFARFMEFVAVDKLYPQLKIWEDFATSVLPLAQSLDALRSSHPVEVVCHHERDVSALFDMISYAKGASLIRMCADYVGDANFWSAIQLYLERHQYGNTVSADLWSALSEASGDPTLPGMMHAWVSQIGYPVICVGDDGAVVQERFLADGGKCSDGGLQWPIPVKLVMEGQDCQCIVMRDAPGSSSELAEILAGAASAGKWVKVNAGQVGFYRVQYSSSGWRELRRAASTGVLSPVDRMGLVLDAAGLACSGRIGMDILLSQCLASKADTDPMVQESIASVLGRLIPLYENESWFEEYARMVCTVCGPMLAGMGWSRKEGEDSRITASRPLLVQTLAAAKDEKVVARCVELFQSYPSVAIAADLHTTVLSTAVSSLGLEAYEQVLTMYRTSENVEVRTSCLQALGCGKSPELLRRALEWSLDSGEVRSQDLPYPIGAVAARQAGAAVAWSLFRSRFEELRERLSPTGFLWQRLVGACVSGPYAESQAKEVETFFAEPGRGLGCASKNYSQSLERLRSRAAQLVRDTETIPLWLKKGEWQA